MNNLINMSDHEKVIFVTGIDETRNAELSGGIKTLAADYPFAIFFTSDDTASETFKYPIMNIWKGGLINGEIQGVRLTRFMGIDENNNTLQIGDHTVKLLFDYDSGKLGLYDANKLESLELIHLSYTDVNGNSREITYPGNNSFGNLINSKDNKFILTFEFKSTDDGDPRKISNTLNIDNDPNDFSLASKSSNSYSEELHKINNVYNYDIKKDTYEELNNALTYKSYNFVSQYASDKTVSAKFCFILNPTEFTMYYKGLTLGSTIREIGTNLPEPAKIDVNFTPSNVTSYPARQLYMTITSENPEYVKVCTENGIDANTFPIREGISTFWLKPADNIINEDVSTNLNIEIGYTLDRTGQHIYSYLSRQVRIILTGEQINTFWYAGFDDPTSTGFDINDLLMFNAEDLSNDEYFLYDWTNQEVSPTDRLEIGNFFIAIPYTYKDIIKPRWDAYHIDNITNKKVYEECTSWFEIYKEHYTIKNIDFYIYKSTVFTGKFYGKIK